MRMRKSIIALLAAICMILSVCTLGAFAEGTSQVYAETDASVGQGSYGYCYVYLDDLTDLASLNVAVYYDTERVSVTDSYNQVACSLYDSSNKDGCLQYSYIFDGEGSNAKTNLFYFCYQVNENAEIGNTYFDIVVTDAYNTAIESVDINGSRCSFTITEKTVAKTAYIYGSSYIIATSVKEEFEISYSLSDWQIASGSMVISYDPELFEFVELTNGEFLDGKLVDVNTSLDGSVYLSFLATEYNYSTDLLKVKFRTQKNVTEISEIKLTVSELYDLERNRIVCDGYTTSVSVTHDVTYAEDSPSVSLSASYDAQTDKVTVTVLLEKDSHLGAGDFVLNFDTNYLTYSSATKGFTPSFFNVNDKNVDEGILKFSIISLSDITEEHTVLTVVFDVTHACEDKLVDFEISGSGLADSLTDPILLNFVDVSVTLPLKHKEAAAVVENMVGASCTEDGHYDSVVYCSLCGEELSRTEKTIDKLGHDYTEQEDNAIRTTAASCQECHTYWYDCSRCGKSAKDDANATDKWYTSTEAGAHSYTKKTETDAYLKAEGTDCQTHHIYYFACEHCGASSKGDTNTFYEGAAVGEHKMSADWTSENGQHFHKCTVDGCTHTDTKVNCSGGTATCQARAICSICGESYGELGGHSFNMNEWGYQGTDGHAHKCTAAGCDAHDTLVPHTPNVDAATEDTAKYCTVCDFVIEQKLNHVHVEGTEWESNSTHHWHDCVGNDGQEYSKAEHSYDNACDTDCNVCGYERTVTHDYTKLEKSDTHHWYECSVCDVEKPNSRVEHSGDKATCQAKASCSVCGENYGNLGDHDYDTTKWVSVDEDHHAHKCKLCDAYTDAADHFSEDEETCTEDKLCDACGHKMKDAHGHNYTKKTETDAYLKAEGTDCQTHHTYYFACEHCGASSKGNTDTFYEGAAVGGHKMSQSWTSENGQHFHKCTVDGCTHTDTKVNCSGGTATCQAKAVCSTCQVAYGEYAEHAFSSTWEYKDATGHAHVCTVMGCGEHDEIQPHTPNIPAATEDEAQICTACGYQMAAQLGHTHVFGTDWITDASNHWKECECDEKNELGAHTDSDNNGKCDICDYTMSSGTVDPGVEPDPQPPVGDPPTHDNDGLGSGAIAGIVAGSTVVVVGGGFALWWFVFRKKRII